MLTLNTATRGLMGLPCGRCSFTLQSSPPGHIKTTTHIHLRRQHATRDADPLSCPAQSAQGPGGLCCLEGPEGASALLVCCYSHALAWPCACCGFRTGCVNAVAFELDLLVKSSAGCLTVQLIGGPTASVGCWIDASDGEGLC